MMSQEPWTKSVQSILPLQPLTAKRRKINLLKTSALQFCYLWKKCLTGTATRFSYLQSIMSKCHNYYTMKGFELHSIPDSHFFFFLFLFITSLVYSDHNESCSTVYNFPLNHLLMPNHFGHTVSYNTCHISCRLFCVCWPELRHYV